MRIFALCFEDVFFPSGGMGVHCRDLYTELGKLGHEIVILTISAHSPTYGKQQLAENVEVFKIHNGSTYDTNEPFALQFIMEQNFTLNALEFYGREKFDLIHAHDSHLWKTAEALQALWKIPIILTSHLSPMLHEVRFATDRLAEYKTQLEGTALCNADRVIAVSEYYKQELKKTIIGRDSVVIHNGVNGSMLNEIEADPTVRDRWGIPEGKMAMFVGRMVHAKGVEQFVTAAKELPDVQFVVVSYLPEVSEKHYPLAQNVRKAEAELTNFKWIRNIPHDDKVRLMKTATWGVVPSTYEPFGIVALEWMVLGVPLIVSRRGGLVEFCNDDNSTLIEPDADSIIEAIKNYEPNDQRIARAKGMAFQHQWSRVAEKTEQIYQEVISEHGRGTFDQTDDTGDVPCEGGAVPSDRVCENSKGGAGSGPSA